MARLLVFAAIAALVFRWVTGRWPWQKRVSTRQRALHNARILLGVGERADRRDILAAHRRLVAMVHPDRGGSNRQVHEANDARDLLLDHLARDLTGPGQEPT